LVKGNKFLHKGLNVLFSRESDLLFVLNHTHTLALALFSTAALQDSSAGMQYDV